MSKKILVFSLLVFVFFPFLTLAESIEEIQKKIDQISREISKIQKLIEELKKKEVLLSSKELEQGDTLIIKIKTELPAMPFGIFNKSKISFFKTKDGWLGILGIGTKEKPGKYDLVLKFPDKSEFKEKIEIKERSFKVSPFWLTKELIKRGWTQEKIIKNLASKDNFAITKVLKIFTPFPYFKESFIFPLEEIRISEEFGEIKKYKNVAYQHLGVDFQAKEGTPVFAPNDGVCKFSRELPNYGKTIIIDHGLGIFSLYLHLKEFKIKEGDFVKRGQIIGSVGNTGYSTSPHLHFSIKIERKSVDPLRFIELTQKEL